MRTERNSPAQKESAARRVALADLKGALKELEAIYEHFKSEPETPAEEIAANANQLRGIIEDVHDCHPNAVPLGGTPGIRSYGEYFDASGALDFEKFQRIARQERRLILLQDFSARTPVPTLCRIFEESTEIEAKKRHLLAREKLAILEVLNHRLAHGQCGDEALDALLFLRRVAREKRFQGELTANDLREKKASDEQTSSGFSLAHRAGEIIAANEAALMDVIRTCCVRELRDLNGRAPGAPIDDIVRTDGKGFEATGRINSPHFERYRAAVSFLKESFDGLGTKEQKERVAVRVMPTFSRHRIQPFWARPADLQPYSGAEFLNPWGQPLVVKNASELRYQREDDTALDDSAENALRMRPMLNDFVFTLRYGAPGR